MRHLWGFAGAVGLLVFVMFGTYGCLTEQVDDPTATRSLLIALGGLVVAIVAQVARGHGPSSLLKGRQALGALGLVLTPILAVLMVLAISADVTTVARFFVLFLLAMALWAQGIAIQPGLSFRVAFVWLGTLVIGVAAAVVAIGLIGVVLEGLGLASNDASQLIRALGIAGATLLGLTWASGRPDRLALPKALGRAALGRATPSDVELLAAGPRPILRRRPGTEPGQGRVDAVLAAADARLADVGEDPAHVDPDIPPAPKDA